MMEIDDADLDYAFILKLHGELMISQSEIMEEPETRISSSSLQQVNEFPIREVQPEMSIPTLDESITVTISATGGKLHKLVDLKLLVLHASLRELQHKSGDFSQTKNDYLFLVTNKLTNQDFDRQGIIMGENPSSADLLDYQLTSVLPQEFVIYKGGSDLPTAKEWREACVVSLTGTDLCSLAVNPNSPDLVVLFLHANNHLSDIPPSFFDLMSGLRFLDLSGIRSRTLPSSLVSLTKLQVLLLRNCVRLNNLPVEIEKLHGLEVLDLLGTELYSLPHQLSNLTCLKDLQLSLYGPDNGSEYVHLPPKLVPQGTLSKLQELQGLSIVVHPEDHRWRKMVGEIMKEIMELKMLRHLQFYFPEIENLQEFVQMSLSWSKLMTFKFVVGHDVKRIAPRVPEGVESKYDQLARCLRFVNGDDLPKVIQQVLKRATAFCLDHHLQVHSLSQFGISNLEKLKLCVVRECSNVKVIIDYEKTSEAILPFLEYLEIHYLWKLLHIWKSADMPKGSFGALKHLAVYMCPELQFVLPVTMITCLSNLEELVVEDCESVTKIIDGSTRIFKDNVTMLPRLRKVQLLYLPQLVIFGNGMCLAEEQIRVYGCPNLNLNVKGGVGESEMETEFSEDSSTSLMEITALEEIMVKDVKPKKNNFFRKFGPQIKSRVGHAFKFRFEWRHLKEYWRHPENSVGSMERRRLVIWEEPLERHHQENQGESSQRHRGRIWNFRRIWRMGGGYLERRTSSSNGESISSITKLEEELNVSSRLLRFTFNDLKLATRNFRPDSLLGEGGFGCVFKGWIEGNGTAPAKPGTGLTVAVKTFNHDGLQGHKEWLAEVKFLGDLLHANLVKLIGYCIEDDQRLLVYEFMPRGSLEYHLFRKSLPFPPLPWSIRMKIALGAAKGLAFLHEEAERLVIYRDFKTSNILLDAEYNAKLSDFGLAKDAPDEGKTHVSTRVMGTYGYAAPEYVMTGHLTSKSDVYSFGVVLLEMLTGRRSMDKRRPSGEQNLVEWFYRLIDLGKRPHLGKRKRFYRLIDPRLEGHFSIKGAQKAAQLAARCLSWDPKVRPVMSEVVEALKPLANLKDMASSSQHFQTTQSDLASPNGKSGLRIQGPSTTSKKPLHT